MEAYQPIYPMVDNAVALNCPRMNIVRKCFLDAVLSSDTKLDIGFVYWMFNSLFQCQKVVPHYQGFELVQVYF